METFTEGCMEQDPRFRRYISPNHWKAISGEKSWVGAGWRRADFLICMGKRKCHMLVRGYLLGIWNLLLQSGLFLNIASLEKASLKTPSKMELYFVLCTLSCKCPMFYWCSTLLFNSPPDYKLPESRGFLKATTAVLDTGSSGFLHTSWLLSCLSNFTSQIPVQTDRIWCLDGLAWSESVWLSWDLQSKPCWVQGRENELKKPAPSILFPS